MRGKACLISCSDHYDHRLRAWDRGLRQLHYSTKYLTSDFDHATKLPFVCTVPGCVQIHVTPYQKNLSIRRILSHYQFAQRVAAYLETEQPDVIVALLPPNFLAQSLARYKRKHPKVRLIFDIFDLWPETFPSGKSKWLLSPVFKVWAYLRNSSLPAADFVSTECDMFRDILHLGANSRAVYFAAEPTPVASLPDLPEDHLSLCYLGSINNIIDIPRICDLIRSASRLRSVRLHIIGKGERQQEFIDAATAAGAEVIFHDAIYDAAEKQRIMDQCHFGLNILKPSVCIGLTMKSVDYFRHGLPIINSIPADTQQLVLQYGIGIPYDGDCAARICSISLEENLAMRHQAKLVFEEKFTEHVIQHTVDCILNEVVRCL